MSLTGEKQLTGAKGLVKRDYTNQKSIATGFKKLRALDKPGLDASGIDLTALTLPTEVTGFANPSAAELSAAKLLFFKRNLVVKSSSKGELIQDLAYKVTSNTFIEFIGFTAEENEIFEILIDDIPATGLQVVDAQPLIATGTLSANTTEFNVGEPFELNKYPTRQIGAVAVFLDGVLQFRNSSNAAADPGADGNYHEKAAGGTNLATIIEFNEVDPVEDREVLVMSTQGYAERPDGSMMAFIEQLQATVDILVEDAAAGFGNPETRYQPAPTQPDLKQFGDRVFQAEQDIEDLQTSKLDAANVGDSEVVVDTASGHGSTNTNIRYFTNIQSNTGSDISVTNDSSLGTFFTINQDGIYCIVYSDGKNATDKFKVGITRNASGGELTAGPDNVASGKLLAYSATNDNAGDTTFLSSCTRILSAGDIIRPHTNANSNDPDGVAFISVTQIMKL